MEMQVLYRGWFLERILFSCKILQDVVNRICYNLSKNYRYIRVQILFLQGQYSLREIYLFGRLLLLRGYYWWDDIIDERSRARACARVE